MSKRFEGTPGQLFALTGLETAIRIDAAVRMALQLDLSREEFLDRCGTAYDDMLDCVVNTARDIKDSGIDIVIAGSKEDADDDGFEDPKKEEDEPS
jgi:hypothetical protein